MSRDQRDHDKRDRGETFVEILMSIVLLGIVLMPLFNAVMMSVKTSTQNRSTARAESALQDAADRINRSPMACDYSSLAQVAAQAQGWAPSAATVTHQRYVPAANPTLPGTWVNGACADGLLTPNVVQSITVTITAPGSIPPRSMQVVKSDV
jgi:Tfp pilus assembly protein PilX